MATYTNQPKDASTFSNQMRGGAFETWDSSVPQTWDSNPQATWNDPTFSYTNQPKDASTFSNQVKH